MTRLHTPLQQLKEARQIARDHGMFVAECPEAPGKTRYIVYRKLPDGRNARLGARSNPTQLRQYVARLAGFH